MPHPLSTLFATPSRRRFTGAAALLLVLAGVGIWYAASPAERGGPGRPGGGPPIPVGTTEVATGPLTVYLDALGSVTPANSVLVQSRVDGQLLRLHFTEGETVRPGQLLAEIDPRPFEVLLTQARGQLARDSALLRNARTDLQRYRELWEQDSIARQLVDGQEALVQQYEGAVEAGRGLVGSAELQLDYARITAPIGGVVGLRRVDPGNIVRTGDTAGLVLITQLQPAQVVFTLPEDVVPQLREKMAGGARLQVEAYDRALRSRLATGELRTLDNQIDAATGTVRLKAEFANADGALFPNQFVNVRLRLETLPEATLVATAAIQRGATGSFVYALGEDATVRLQPVVLGATEAERIAVLDGLRAGDVVVIDGIDRLRSGARVAPVAVAPAGAPRTAQAR